MDHPAPKPTFLLFKPLKPSDNGSEGPLKVFANKLESDRLQLYVPVRGSTPALIKLKELYAFEYIVDLPYMYNYRPQKKGCAQQLGAPTLSKVPSDHRPGLETQF